jgi:hypothetical protein
MGGDDTVISAGDTVISADDTVISADDTVISTDDTVISTDDTVISTDDTVISADDTVLPLEKNEAMPTGSTTAVMPVPDVLPPAAAPAEIFTLRMVTGTRLRLTSAVVVGRAPKMARLSREDTVQLVSVSSREARVSGTHVEIRPLGTVVVVTDLHSTNGTTVTLHDGVIVRLGPGDSLSVGEGAVVDIGDGNRIEVLRETPRDAGNSIAR